MSDLRNHDAERALLGGVLLAPDEMPVLRGVLEPGEFSRDAHGLIWRHLGAMDDEGVSIDLVALVDRLERTGVIEAAGGLGYVASLSDNVPTTANLGYYARIVHEHAQRRRLRDVCLRGGEAVARLDDPTEIAAALVAGADGVTEVAVDALVPVSQVVVETWAEIVERQDAVERGDPPAGLDLGWPDLRELVGPQPGDLLVVAGRPGMGKSALASQAGTHVASRGGGVVSLQLEMPRRKEVERILCREARVSLTAVRDGRMSERDRERMVRAGEFVHSLPMLIDDTPGQSIASIRASIHRAARQFERAGTALALVIVDYLQLMEGGGEAHREQQVAAMSRGLKLCARRYNCVVMALSQLNRGCEARENKRPRMSDLRESGAIEQDADGVMFVYRDDYYREDSPDKGIAEVIVAKNRHGEPGYRKLAWQGEFTRFEGLARGNVVPFVPTMTVHYGDE